MKNLIIVLVNTIATLLSGSMAVAAFTPIQTEQVACEGHEGHAAKTKSGTITALHVGCIDYDFLSHQMDLALDTSDRSESGFSTSDLPPSYFVDRRGVRHDLKATHKLDSQTVVSIRFFPGESGMPVFADDGSVTCIVLGNVDIGGRWFGRISRVTPILEFANKVRNRKRVLRTRR